MPSRLSTQKEESNKGITSDMFFDIHKRVILAVNYPIYFSLKKEGKIRFKEERNKGMTSDMYFDIHKRVIPAVNYPLKRIFRRAF